MSQVIVLDGPRGVGKSTTAKKIVDFLIRRGVRACYHKHQRDTDELAYMMGETVRWIGDNHDVVVVDRFIATEWVHSILNGREDPRHLTQECLAVEAMLSSRGAWMYVLNAPADVLMRRIEERGERKMDQPLDSLCLWTAASGVFRHMETVSTVTTDDFEDFVSETINKVLWRLRWKTRV